MVHFMSPSNGAYAQWTVYQNGRTSKNRCEVPAVEFKWYEMDGSWASLSLASGKNFGVDTTNRLYTRQVSPTSTS